MSTTLDLHRTPAQTHLALGPSAPRPVTRTLTLENGIPRVRTRVRSYIRKSGTVQPHTRAPKGTAVNPGEVLALQPNASTI